MKLKLNKDGSAVIRNGAPVYILSNGTEREIDAGAAMKLAIGKHFEASPVMGKLNIPHQMAAAFFGDAFQVQGDKLVAIDSGGVPMYSTTRHGQPADFDEALSQLIDRYPKKAMIQRDAQTAAPGEQAQHGPVAGTITRSQFDAMPQGDRAKFFKDGGRIAEPADRNPSATPKPAPGSKVWTRAQYNAAPIADWPAFFAAGGKVVD